MPRHSLRHFAPALLVLALSGCSTTMKVGISVDPPSSSVFINGVRDGQGARRIHEIDFGTSRRIAIQAVAPGFEPLCEMLTRQQVEDQLEKYGDFVLVLKQEK